MLDMALQSHKFSPSLTCAQALVAGHGAIRLDAVLEAVQLPAGVTHLDSGLADMDADTLTLKMIENVNTQNKTKN